MTNVIKNYGKHPCRGDFIVDSPDKSAYIYVTFIQVEKKLRNHTVYE